METITEKLSEKLNDLLEKTYDAEKGFKKAAENVEHAGLKAYFEEKADQRYNFGHELKKEIRAIGGEVDKGGSAMGTAHRTWMDIKAFLSLDSEESMLEEAIRGEKAAIDDYEDVLEEATLPPSTKAIITSQKLMIQNGLSNIKKMEDLR
ncbi:ferritin-like domain-containing protein [Flavobacteriaceae bacterium M23B6Z8]